MTMTRDKIEELLRQAAATPDGCRMLVEVADVIALAERALPELDWMTLKKMQFIEEQGGELVGVIMARGSERAHIDMGRVTWSGALPQPQEEQAQGQALPEPAHRANVAWQGTPPIFKDLFTADQMRDFFAQGFDAGRAFQLSPPALPSDEHIKAFSNHVIREISEYDDRSSPEDQPEMLLVTANELEGEIRAAFRAYASQLALPAGPVPEDALPEIVQAARDIVKLWDSEHVSEDDYNEEMVRIEKLFRALIGSPAVAQPVADERYLPLSKLMDVFEVMLWNARTAISHQSAIKAIEGLQTDFKKIIAQYKSEQSEDKPVGEVRFSPERGWHMRALRDWRSMGEGTLLYTARAALCQPADEGDKA